MDGCPLSYFGVRILECFSRSTLRREKEVPLAALHAIRNGFILYYFTHIYRKDVVVVVIEKNQ